MNQQGRAQPRGSTNRWRVVTDAVNLLAAADEPGAITADIADLVVPAASHVFVLYLPGQEQIAPVVEVARANDPQGRLARKARVHLEREGGFLAILSHDGVVGVDNGLEFRPLLDALELRLGAVAPLRVERSIGFVLLGASGWEEDTFMCRSLCDGIAAALTHSRLEQRARRAVAGRDRAFEIVAHDLGSPLTAVRICASALLDQEPPPIEGIRDMARIILRSTAWMQNILNDMLDRASLDSGLLALHRAPIDVSEVVSAARAIFAPVAEEEEVHFEVLSPPVLPRIDADGRRLLQVLLNLLSNAIKFTPPGGRVVLASEVIEEPGDGGPQPLIRFAVSDTGPGIPDEDVRHVFDWHWHSGNGRAGTGIGLAIAQGLVEAHGSRIHVESAPGRGSTFWFTIPLRAPAAPNEREHLGASRGRADVGHD